MCIIYCIYSECECWATNQRKSIRHVSPRPELSDRSTIRRPAEPTQMRWRSLRTRTVYTHHNPQWIDRSSWHGGPEKRERFSKFACANHVGLVFENTWKSTWKYDKKHRKNGWDANWGASRARLPHLQQLSQLWDTSKRSPAGLQEVLGRAWNGSTQFQPKKGTGPASAERPSSSRSGRSLTFGTASAACSTHLPMWIPAAIWHSNSNFLLWIGVISIYTYIYILYIMHVSCQCMNISRKGKLISYISYISYISQDMKSIWYHCMFTSLEIWWYMMPPFTPIKTQPHISQYRPGFHGGHVTAMRCGDWCDPISIHFDSYIITSGKFFDESECLLLFFLSVWLRSCFKPMAVSPMPGMNSSHQNAGISWCQVPQVPQVPQVLQVPQVPRVPAPFSAMSWAWFPDSTTRPSAFTRITSQPSLRSEKKRTMSHKKEDLAMRKGEFPRKIVVFMVYEMIYPLRMVVYFRTMVNFQRVYGEKGSNKPMVSSHGFFWGRRDYVNSWWLGYEP